MPDRPALAAVVSVHDVMPATLDEVATILSLTERHAIGPVTLLVVPGLDWTAEQLATLRRWQDAGHELAGHGWRHRAETIRGLSHRLHSLVLSRDAAEHLALDSGAIAVLVRRCFGWFWEAGLDAPRLYVPPAWAMGAIARPALEALPFRYVEVLSGVLDTRARRLERMPLVGFEADTAWRAHALRRWNRINLAYARRRGVPLRVAIHPHDLGLRLAEDVGTVLAAVTDPAPAVGSS